MRYTANWKIEGLPGGPLMIGDTREIDEETAAQLLRSGSISPVPADATAKTDAVCPGCSAPRSGFATPQAWGAHKARCKGSKRDAE